MTAHQKTSQALSALNITEPIETAIGQDIEFEGKLTIRNGRGIAIFGRVTGSIESDGTVVIAEGAQVKGSVVADTIAVSGEVDAQAAASGAGEPEIHARVSLVLGATAKVSAKTVSYDAIQMERGAKVEGNLRFVAAADEAVSRAQAKAQQIKSGVQAEAPLAKAVTPQAANRPLPILSSQDKEGSLNGALRGVLARQGVDEAPAGCAAA